jgi:hypothetical protein
MIGAMNSNLTDKKQIRKFGLIAFIFFGILCGLGIWKERLLPTFLFGFLSTIGIGFVVAPSPLRPIYNAWLRFAHLIGRALTTLIMILIYYLVITPAALIKRLFGGNPLPVKPIKKVSSYWVTRSEPVQPRERFFKRY